MKARLTQGRTIWALFFLLIVLTLIFLLVMKIWDFHVIDEMSNPEAIRAHIAAMSPEQRRVHLVTSATLDVVYPFVYGALFIGMAWKFFPRASRFLVPLIALTIPVDLAECLVQVLALSGNDDVVDLKAIITPVKLVLFFIGVFTAIAGAVRSRSVE